jgi:hypothetical protein
VRPLRTPEEAAENSKQITDSSRAKAARDDKQ